MQGGFFVLGKPYRHIDKNFLIVLSKKKDFGLIKYSGGQ